MAFEMLAFMFLGVWGGNKLDHYYQLEFPVFLLSLSLLGAVASIWLMIKRLPKDD